MTTWIVTRHDGSTLEIVAARFVTDGSGTRFFDAGDAMVAAFADGQITAVYPAPPDPPT
jgi:hypothetical protein